MPTHENLCAVAHAYDYAALAANRTYDIQTACLIRYL